jgi:glycosyltransferase involved in cell wall biosynthesis
MPANRTAESDSPSGQQRVSVIVPTYNRARYLRECLDSLLAQTIPAWEILLVDDGSEDDTPAIAASYGQRLRHFRKENGGKPSAVNMALAEVTGTLIWLFDDDDVALPDAIESRLAALHAVPGAAFVYSGHYIGTDGADGRIVQGRLHTPPQPSKDAFFLALMKNCFFHLNSALVRRECYSELAGIDPSLRSGEDYDFQIRIARNAQPAFCPKPSFIFRQHDGVRGAKASSYAAEKRNRVFRESSAAIGRKVRRDVSLGEFLVPRRSGEIDPVDTRKALLNRVQVMANLGCIPELFDDLRRIVLESGGRGGLSDPELREIGTALRIGYAYEASADIWPDFVRLSRELGRLPGGNKVVRTLAYSLYLLARGYPGSWFERTSRASRALQLAFASLG